MAKGGSRPHIAGMTFRPGLIERAYQLAREGRCRTVGDIKIRLAEEGFTGIQGGLYGPALATDLRKLCEEHYVAP